MAAAKKGGKKRSPWVYAGVGVGGLAVIYLYKRYKANSSAVAANTAAGLVGGTTIPAASTGTLSTASPLTTFALWEQAAIAAMTSSTYSASQALNDIGSWINGTCVSQAGFTAIGNFIETGGLPPGFSTGLPSLSVCPSTGTGGDTGGSGGGTGGSTGGTGSGSGSGSGAGTPTGTGVTPAGPFDRNTNPYGLGPNLPGQPAGSPGDTVTYQGQPFQPYLGANPNAATQIGNTAASFLADLQSTQLPVGSIAGYAEGAGRQIISLVTSPGYVTQVDTATGQAVGPAKPNASAAGYFTSGVTDLSAPGVYSPGGLPVWNPSTGKWQQVQEIANQTGGYG